MGTIIASDLVAEVEELIMTGSGISEVPFPAFRTSTLDSEDDTSLPPRATGGDDRPQTFLPLLQDPFPLNPKYDKEEITSEDDSNTTPPTPWFMNRGCTTISVAIIIRITIVLFPSVWLKIGV